MDKPEETPRIEYYIKRNVSAIFKRLNAIGQSTTEIFGGWYCDHCKKWHGRRVVRYIGVDGQFIVDMCSLGNHKGIKYIRGVTYKLVKNDGVALFDPWGDILGKLEENEKYGTK